MAKKVKNTWFKKTILAGMSMALLAPNFSYGFGESDVSRWLNQSAPVPLLKPGWANFFLHQNTLKSLYSTRGFSAIWVSSNGSPNSSATELRRLLKSAHLQGLNPNDYWDNNMETMFNANNITSAWVTFELAASEALIRYVTHLQTGRFDPKQIDDDIKFSKKVFSEYTTLNNIISSSGSLDAVNRTFAPTHVRYKNLVSLIADLYASKTMGGWQTISAGSTKLVKGVSSSVIGQVRTRLNQMGYTVSTGSNSFDDELDRVVRQFQAANAMGVDGVIGNEVIRSLNTTVADRIHQVELNMEKLRWLPKQLEGRHAFVNLANSNFKLYDNGSKVFDFKTINGQVFRRTPSMRDVMHFVELNPTWTVPHSIATRDKLPVIQKNPGYVDKANMDLIDLRTDKVVDPYSVDWSSVSKTNFRYSLVQRPGYRNALGVVKFPLTNAWAIYLHGTDDYSLFNRDKRLISSGCVRLEDPLTFAEYILKDNVKTTNLKYGNTRDGNWPLSKIMSVVPQSDSQKPDPAHLKRRIELERPVPVYMLYLTAEKDEDGTVRYTEDAYGQDYRISKAIKDNRKGNELF